jgi:7-cyano-7-deazaguanine synthase
MTKKAIALLSGGLDSATLLYQLKYEDYEPVALSVDYGQKHLVELDAAVGIAAAAGVQHMLIDLSTGLLPVFQYARSSQVNELVDVPHGHYADESMKLTVVPNRNMLLLAVAGALAESLRQQKQEIWTIGYAAHAGDHPIYPDCRPEFYFSCQQTLEKATDGHVTLYAPFGKISKTDIVRRAVQLHVPVELTYSCYEGGEDHCGLCGTCTERIEAFRDAGVPDPTTYKVAV